MARSFPADARSQHFFEEQYNKETAARLKFHADLKACSHLSGDALAARRRSPVGPRVIFGLPQINPMEFALNKKRAEDEELKRIIEEARAKQSNEEMRKVDERSKNTLYDGFSREGSGVFIWL